MKIHRVDLTGFGPYRGHEFVDFDAFAADGIFLITGRTGAGKTSILDAITYALFGRVPRYDSAAGDKVRSDHLGPTDVCEVVLEFSVPAGRHKVVRRPAYQRRKQRGSGLTTVRAFFELSVLRDDGEWAVLETKEGNADRFVSDVLPLTAEQFQQVILLAQGQFQEFLVAGSDKRRELLSKLFDTSRFTAYGNDLDERARVLRRQVEALSTRVATHASTLARQVGVEVPEHVEVSTGAGLSQWAGSVLAEQVRALETARRKRDDATSQLEHDRAGLTREQTLLERQQRRRDAEERHRALVAGAGQVDDERVLVERAARAALVIQACRVRDSRAAELDHARHLLGEAVESVRGTSDLDGDGATVPLDALRETTEGLTADLAGLDDALAAERSLPDLHRAVDRAEEALERFEVQRAGTEARRSETTREIDELTSRCDDLEVALVALGDGPATLEVVQQGRDAARALDTVTRDRALALGQQVEAQREVTRTSGELSALLERQLAEYAGALARELVEGEACQVCGSVEHSRPAALLDGHVDEQKLTDARDAASWAAKRAQECDAAVVRLDTRRADLLERVAGRDLEAWEEEVRAVEQRLEELRATRTQLELTKGVLTARRQSLSKLVEAVAEEHDRRSALLVALAGAKDALARCLEQVEEARGTHPSVGQRREECLGRKARLTRLVERREGVERAVLAHEAAAHDLQTALGEQGFDSEQEALDAFVAPDEVARLTARVRRHDAQLESVRQVLSSPELQDLPSEAADVESWQVACAASGERHNAALQAFGSAQQLHTTVTEVVGRIEEDLAGSASVRREYDLVNGLAATLRGQGQNERRMALESFALAAELEEIVAAANRRLERMTHGRFSFQHTDAEESKRVASGLGLDVLDAHTGECRSPRSLSGGEKFQASLALALGLAEVVTARAGGLRLDTLFIDEGFGTLDPETLEATMATLDGLREGGRTIGLISHVTALKESIPCQVHVETTRSGWSTIQQP